MRRSEKPVCIIIQFIISNYIIKLRKNKAFEAVNFAQKLKYRSILAIWARANRKI